MYLQLNKTRNEFEALIHVLSRQHWVLREFLLKTVNLSKRKNGFYFAIHFVDSAT